MLSDLSPPQSRVTSVWAGERSSDAAHKNPTVNAVSIAPLYGSQKITARDERHEICASPNHDLITVNMAGGEA